MTLVQIFQTKIFEEVATRNRSVLLFLKIYRISEYKLRYDVDVHLLQILIIDEAYQHFLGGKAAGP